MREEERGRKGGREEGREGREGGKGGREGEIKPIKETRVHVHGVIISFIVTDKLKQTEK